MSSVKSEQAFKPKLRWKAGGKPVLEGAPSLPDVSISHDGDLCLVGLGSHAQGIDLETIKSRDARDSSRADAPMIIAGDALLLDTTDLDIEAAFDAAVGLIKRKIGQQG